MISQQRSNRPNDSNRQTKDDRTARTLTQRMLEIQLFSLREEVEMQSRSADDQNEGGGLEYIVSIVAENTTLKTHRGKQ